jgi:hypothetical protein
MDEFMILRSVRRERAAMPPRAADDRRSRHGRKEQREEQEEDKKRDVGWIGKKIELLLDLDSNRSLRRRIISATTMCNGQLFCFPQEAFLLAGLVSREKTSK